MSNGYGRRCDLMIAVFEKYDFYSAPKLEEIKTKMRENHQRQCFIFHFIDIGNWILLFHN